MSETLVKVEGVSKKFCRSLKKSLWYGMQDLGREITGQTHGGGGKLRPDEFWAVKDVSFELKRGECIGLIGHNGAGKTTLLKILNGLIKPDTGRIEMKGRVGALIALGAGFNPILTGRENIYVNGSILGLTKEQIEEKIEGIIDFSEIRDFIDSPVQNYSSGMTVRLGFAIAAKTEPDILLLDEVLAVGDVSFQAKCFNTIASFREKGTAFILVSHNMHQVARYAEQVLYLKKGKIAFSGSQEQGIEKFMVDMNQSDSGLESGTTDWSQTYGSGKVVFTNGRFRNSTGDVVTTIDVGESVTLQLDYKQHDEIDESPILDLIIRNREGILFQGTNVVSGQPFEIFPQTGHICVTFHNLPINSQYVEFFFTLLINSTGEVLDWKRNFRLNIRPLPLNAGQLSLVTTWKIQ